MIKNCLVWIFLVSLNALGFSQNIETDIFNDLKYESDNNGYEACLKEDVFGNLIFSDSHDNEVTFSKKYLHSMHTEVLDDSGRKTEFFRELIYRYQRHEGYEATYSVDMFGHVIIEEEGGHLADDSNTKSIRKDILGTYNYDDNNCEATLKKDIFDKWVYEDSRGNEFNFSTDTWQHLIRRHGSAENLLLFLTREFLK